MEPRPYTDVLDAWRTSCPRLTIWEDATDRGFVEQTAVEGEGLLVRATDAGRQYLRSNGRMAG